MTKSYSAWPTTTEIIGPNNVIVPDFGPVVLEPGESYALRDPLMVVTMAEAKFADLPVEWVEA